MTVFFCCFHRPRVRLIGVGALHTRFASHKGRRRDRTWGTALSPEPPHRLVPAMAPAPPQPATLEEVFAIVTGATSQDPVVLKASTDQLEHILGRPGTLDFLQEIAVQKTVPAVVRQQSIIQVKNNMKHWKAKR